MPRRAPDSAVDPAADPFVRRFRAHLHRSGLLPGGAHILVAVSGGIDSITLLHLLRFELREFDYRLTAAHFDHGMRADSVADSEWVRGVCRAWNVPLVEGLAASLPRSEADARAARYTFLHDAAGRVHAAFIATAHHADDQAETVLFRLLRGTGPAGLAGIPSKRGSIVRPLLPFTRAAIAARADRAGIIAREDPTNLDLRFARNRIRHMILPALERTSPGATRALRRVAQQVARDEAAWSVIIDDMLERLIVEHSAGSISLARTGLLGYHRQIRARIIRRVFALVGLTPGRAGTRAALAFINSGASGRTITLQGGLRLGREFDRLVFRAEADRESVADQPLLIAGPEAGRGTARIAGRAVRVEWRIGPLSGTDVVAFDATVLRFPLELRSWQSGDRIRLASGTKKLKKLFVERRVPRSDRHRLPVLADAGGIVVWVPGVDRTSHAEPVPDRPAFHIRVMDGEHG